MEENNIVKFKGYLTRVLFPKAPKILGVGDNNFGITLWDVTSILDGEVLVNTENLVTVLGNFSEKINEELNYTILAKEVENEKWGIQYELIYLVEDIDLNKRGNHKAFLKEFLSELQIAELYKISENPLKLIDEENKEELMKAKGIGPVIVEKIIKRYKEKKDMFKIYVELESIGLTNNFIKKLINAYRNPDLIIDKVKNHPYSLINLDGVGFLTADNIALKVGIDKKSPERIMAFIKFYLKEQGENGNSYVTAGELLTNIYYNLGGKDEIIENYYDDENNIIGNNISTAIKILEEDNIIILENTENKSRRRVYLTYYYNLENKISKELKRLLSCKNNFIYNNWKDKIKLLEAKQGFEFTEEQKNGIELGLKEQVCFISGMAGTGKSSLVSGILASLDKYSFAQCALSGRAAAQLQEVTGKTGQTIHRLLKYNPTDGFTYNKNNPLDYDIIILDELSLVGGEIYLKLLEAIKDGAKLICLGDMGQLEAIGALNLAADMYNSDKIPLADLQTVHRQAQKSGILMTAYKVRKQEQLFDEINYEGIDILGELQDMILDVQVKKDFISDKIIDYFKKYYYSDLINENIMDIQILTPVKERGDSCVFKLNQKIQEIVNPINDTKRNIHIKKMKNTENDFSYYLQENDKVMCIKNNYDVKDINDYPVSIFNGWLGIIKEITDEFVIIDFPLNENYTVLKIEDAKNYLVLGYASTVHKCQGSGFKVVIGALDYSTPPSMLTSQLVYTLLTRAKKICVLVAQTGALRKAINSNYVSTKRTFLPELLADDTNK